MLNNCALLPSRNRSGIACGRTLWGSLWLLAALLPAFPAVGADSQPEAPAALRILSAWQANQTQPVRRILHIIGWTPDDREYPVEQRTRLSGILKHVQQFYAQEMERHGFGPLTFGLELEDNGDIRIHQIRGQHPQSHYGLDSGSEIRRECLPIMKERGIDIDSETIAIFCNLAEWNAEELTFKHRSPYYAGGTYLSGTAWQLDSPELDINNLPLKTPIMTDGQYGKISLGKHNSIFIGGIAHELGHAFGLPHTMERPDERPRGTSLMGSGNRTYGDDLRGEGRGSFLTFADALRLASHPLFCGKMETQPNRPSTSIEDLAIQADDKSITVTGVVRGTPPVYGVVAYFDTEGHSDYNATSMVAIPAEDGKFVIRSSALTAGKNGELRLLPLHANGVLPAGKQRDTWRYPYSVNPGGKPDVSMIQARLELAPFAAALASGNPKQAAQVAAKLKSPVAKRIARELLALKEPTQSPAEVKGRAQSAALTSFQPASAKVGWLKPTYNSIPEASFLLKSGGQIFTTGLYAHAPAVYEYNLDGKWKSITGRVGLAAGHDGTVKFEIQGDGKSLWQSDVVKEGSLVTFTVDLTGIQKLELLTHPTDDGSGADWGLWLAPQLLR